MESEQVIFSDGIRPGGDSTNPTEPAAAMTSYVHYGFQKAFSGKSEFHITLLLSLFLFYFFYFFAFLLLIFK